LKSTRAGGAVEVSVVDWRESAATVRHAIAMTTSVVVTPDRGANNISAFSNVA
jgi:hypothetical protein